jgi:amino acid transporter
MSERVAKVVFIISFIGILLVSLSMFWSDNETTGMSQGRLSISGTQLYLGWLGMLAIGLIFGVIVFIGIRTKRKDKKQ